MILNKQDILDGIERRVSRLKFKIHKESKYRPDGSIKLSRLTDELFIQQEAHRLLTFIYGGNEDSE